MHAIESIAPAGAVALDQPGAERLQQHLQAQRAAFTAQPFPSLRTRRDALRRLRAALLRHQNVLAQATGGRGTRMTRPALRSGLTGRLSIPTTWLDSERRAEWYRSKEI